VLALLMVLGPARAGLARQPAVVRIGVLPPRVAVPSTRQLSLALDRSVAQLGIHRVMGPTEVKARLVQRPEVSRALEAARLKILEAEQAGLHMNRGQALGAGRAALRLLSAVLARYHVPKLVARARVARALGLLLKPAESNRSRAAFEQALADLPLLEPHPYRLASRAEALLNEARRRQRARPIREPATDDLARLAELARLERIIWVSASPGAGGAVELRLLVFDRETREVRARQRRTLSAGKANEQVAAAVVAAIHGLLRRRTARKSSKKTATPWFRRWWVWTLGAVVLGATAAGVALATRSEEPTPAPPGDFDVRFHF
jgi:hypothetical protein